MLLSKVLPGLINLAFACMEAILGTRFLLSALGANRTSEIYVWVANLSQVIVAPFENIFPSPVIGEIHKIELSTLFAMGVVTLVVFLSNNLISFVSKIFVKNS